MNHQQTSPKKTKIAFINPNTPEKLEKLLRTVIIEKIKHKNKNQPTL